jgi:phosphotransacetylase
LIITDAAINVYPKLEEKADIVQNAIDLAHVLGIATPRVAILSTIETVSSNIPSTIDAAALCKMADRGQIRGGVLDGPLAFDDLESGNILIKQLQSLAGVEAAGVVLGARVPIILTSRAANPKTRLASAAIAALLAQKDRQELSAVSAGFGVLLQSKAWLSSNGSEPR